MFAKINLKALLLTLLTLGLSATVVYSYNPSLACSEHQTKQDAGKTEEKQPEGAAQPPATENQKTLPAETQPTVAPQPSEAPAQPLPTAEALQQGKVLLETRCSTCHPAPRPSTHTVSEWPPVLKRMGAMASLKENEVQLIQQYIEDALKNAPPQGEWDQPQS